MENSNTASETHTMKMQVSMDGLRRNLARDFNDVVEELGYAFENDLQIDWQVMEDKMRELRQSVAVLHCVFSNDKDELFSDLSDETDDISIPKFTDAN